MEENKENVIEEIVDETTSQEQKTETTKKVEQPKTEQSKDENVTKVDFSNFKPREVEQTVHKVDLSKPTKPEENETKEDNTNEGGVVEDVQSENSGATQEQKEVQPEAETQETPVVEEVTEEEEKAADVIEEQAAEAIAESQATGKPLPENIQKLVNFMEETGGDLIDYVRLNQDYNKLDDSSVLREYYRQTKKHLNDEEINFLMEDSFSYNEEEDEERDIRRKKLALKEQVASARAHLDGQKSRYYKELKAGSRLTQEQQKAVNFFNRYKENSEKTRLKGETLTNVFEKKTNEFFGNKFKGFEYIVGEKRFRFNVKDANKVKETQSDAGNFVGKFLNKKTNALEDAAGYHKALFTGLNADAIAKHFYEQGKADAMKDSVAKAKNIDMKPRQSHGQAQNTGGPKFKVLGDNSASFKWKIKNNK